MLSPLPLPIRNGRALVLLVVVACLTPERARAGCEHPGNTFKTNLLAAGEATAAPNEATGAPAPAAPVPCPCRGPNCSGQPDRGAPPATVVLGAAKVREATLDITATDPADGTAAFARDRSSPHPIGRAAAIFHPPRVG